MHILLISLLEDFLNTVVIFLTDVNLVLNLLNLQLGLFMDLLLGAGHVIQLCSHVLNLFGLGGLNVSLSLNVLMALLDFLLGTLISLIEFSLGILGLRQLYLNVSE